VGGGRIEKPSSCKSEHRLMCENPQKIKVNPTSRKKRPGLNSGKKGKRFGRTRTRKRRGSILRRKLNVVA